ncbi:MAG: phytoene/squalene synthase family protein [Acidobacteriota bacterium]|nr:phytoene/squalene synthase family protein [Acidobacteriota bacterium]
MTGRLPGGPAIPDAYLPEALCLRARRTGKNEAGGELRTEFLKSYFSVASSYSFMRESWGESRWRNLDAHTSKLVNSAANDRAAWLIVTQRARSVLRAYSSSFFLVTRFLPLEKRREVEVIYAAVRYPDEVVDTFRLSPAARLNLLGEWGDAYERGLEIPSLSQATAERVPCFIAAFTRVVRDRRIPTGYYRAFLAAMRMDVEPQPFSTVEALIDTYIYGSATVVGYFLAYVYGPSAAGNFERCLASARNLGIALQLTNFLRDVREDRRRGRVYIPLEFLRAEGIGEIDLDNPRQLAPLNRALCKLSAVAESHYAQAELDIDAFAPDSRTAIGACIRVYRQLNQQIGKSVEGVLHRETVPMLTKFHVLPPSKYWRIPLAYSGVL